MKTKYGELERQNKKYEGEIEVLSSAHLDAMGESAEKDKQIEQLQTEVAASFALLQAEKEKASQEREENNSVRNALEARIVELEREISRLSGEISAQEEEKRRREEMEREKRKIRAEMAKKAMEKELREVDGLLSGQEGVLEVVGGDRNKLWRQLQMLMADIHKTGEAIAKDDEEMQTWQLRKLEQTARERTDFSSSLASFEKSLKSINGEVDKLHYLRESLQNWKEELEGRKAALTQEIEEAEKTNDPSLQHKKEEMEMVEESLATRFPADASQTWKTLLVLFEQGKTLLEEGKVSASRMVTVDALKSVEELELDIQRTSDELKEQLEEVEYSMIEIDDILSELKGVHGSRNFFNSTTQEFKAAQDELGDPDSEKRGILGQKIQHLRDEIQKNDAFKKDAETKIKEEKSGLALLMEKITSLQEVSQKRGELIRQLDMVAESAREEDLVEKTHDMEDCIDNLRTLVSRELEVAEKLDEKRRENQSQSRYVAQQGDTVDAMVSDMIAKIFASNEAIVPSNFQRLEEGVYQFGTRKIHASILAGSLVVRVGGGYMKFIDFVKKYGKFESIKIIKAQASSQTPATMIKSGSGWKVLENK
uniref:GAR domain-containing protein n=1 Tax=Paramoeba aestuarina TaxID=180227 RepID=A0A7S4NPD2_9EUKA